MKSQQSVEELFQFHLGCRLDCVTNVQRLARRIRVVIPSSSLAILVKAGSLLAALVMLLAVAVDRAVALVLHVSLPSAAPLARLQVRRTVDRVVRHVLLRAIAVVRLVGLELRRVGWPVLRLLLAIRVVGLLVVIRHRGGVGVALVEILVTVMLPVSMAAIVIEILAGVVVIRNRGVISVVVVLVGSLLLGAAIRVVGPLSVGLGVEVALGKEDAQHALRLIDIKHEAIESCESGLGVNVVRELGEDGDWVLARLVLAQNVQILASIEGAGCAQQIEDFAIQGVVWETIYK